MSGRTSPTGGGHGRDRAEPPVFDVCGPLPQGTTVLEASAGTGKTWTIAALATRYVAEGHATLPELMLVTFGRMATTELRDRVRERLVLTEQGLRRPDAAESPDAVVAHLAAVDDVEREERRARLTRALADVDAATIATTHGFCQQMLTALGTAGDVDRDAVLVPDIADLVTETIDDLYLRGYAARGSQDLDVATARAVARAAVSDHDAVLRPDPAEAEGAAAHRVRFAAAVRRTLAERKRGRRVLHYDDLLTLLRDALVDPVTGPAAVARVRGRYRVVMVDEFQDTDPVQWEILRTAFHGHRTLVLIGDPKQAIYAFRGADLVTYLTAVQEADHVATLGRNWRTDEPVLRGLHTLLAGAALGGPDVVVRDVDAHHRGRRLDGAPPVRLRQVGRGALGGSGTKGLPVGRLRPLLYDDVAAQVVQTLRTCRLRDGDGWRQVEPGDIAVLARRNADAAGVRAALRAAGVPAVESGASSVFAGPAAQDWSTLLGALVRPGHGGRVAAAALTPFLGWDARRLAEAEEAERDELSARVRRWSHLLEEHGVSAVLEAAAVDGMTERLMRDLDGGGERRLTDVRHVAQVLHATATREGLGAAALAEWLRDRIEEAGEDYAEERSRRLETDAAAVHVVTVHSSKGLEFPVVLVPFAWDGWQSESPTTLRYHEAGQRLLHVGGKEDPGYADALARYRSEDLGEDLRLTYVALTRAAAHLVVWWAPAPARTSSSGALSRLLLGDRVLGGEPAGSVPLPKDDEVTRRFAALAAESDGALEHDVLASPPAPVRWAAPPREPERLEVGRWARHIEPWRRTSYSGLTADAHAAPGAAAAGVGDDRVVDNGIIDSGVGTEPESSGLSDEPDVPVGPVPSPGVEDGGGSPSPMADLPGGTGFGTLVHRVLELLDASDGARPTGGAGEDLDARLRRVVEDEVARSGSGAGPALPVDTLAAALGAVMRTPLGPEAQDRTLADVPTADRLAELEFELPLGARPGGEAAVLPQLARLLRAHLPSDDPFSPYADRLESLGRLPLRGYLTGSIDAVLRVPDGRTGADRYVVVDYKTNRLAPFGEPLTLEHHGPRAMAEAMSAAHYPLQLLLYTVALHRLLRWRRPAYDPEVHLGGGLYLFVRGMAGPTTPVIEGTRCGVMAWRPPTALVLATSDLLHGTVRS